MKRDKPHFRYNPESATLEMSFPGDEFGYTLTPVWPEEAIRWMRFESEQWTAEQAPL